MLPPPTTAASTVQPVCLASACAPVSVSKETRFSLPSRCSAITRIVSAISSVLARAPSVGALCALRRQAPVRNPELLRQPAQFAPSRPATAPRPTRRTPAPASPGCAAPLGFSRQVEEEQQQRHHQKQPADDAQGIYLLARLLAVLAPLCASPQSSRRLTECAFRRAAWPPASSPHPAASPASLRSAWSSPECRGARSSTGSAAATGETSSNLDLAQRFVLGLLDADQGGVAQLVDARLNRQHRGQRHLHVLEESALQFALHPDAARFPSPRLQSA